MTDWISDSATKAIDRFGKPYVTWLLQMMTAPSKIVEKTRDLKEGSGLAGYLITIILVSTAIGVAVGAIIPNRPAIQYRAIVFFVVSLLWLFLSLLVQGFCRLLGGKEDARIGIALMAQDLAFAYVASNFVTLLLVWISLTYTPIEAALKKTGVLNEPGSILFSLQFLILLYLVPTTICYAHGFKGLRWFIVALFSAAFAVLFGFPVYAQHSC